ncbi:MAG: hypothetical protein IPP47_03740 [Bryobacterales bacterium]|nr:hypothetical protein [Bryobacterales bacterium]
MAFSKQGNLHHGTATSRAGQAGSLMVFTGLNEATRSSLGRSATIPRYLLTASSIDENR